MTFNFNALKLDRRKPISSQSQLCDSCASLRLSTPRASSTPHLQCTLSRNQSSYHQNAEIPMVKVSASMPVSSCVRPPM